MTTSTIPLVIVPDATEPGAAEVYVDGTLNGRPYRFLLDTGAARSSVVEDPFTLALPAVGTQSSSGVFAVMHDDVITVDRLDVGPIRRESFQLTRTPPGAGGHGSLIGMDVLKDHRIHFRWDQSVLEIDSEQDFAGPSEPLRMDQKAHPYVPVWLGDIEASAVWDTGASLTIADMGFIRRHPDFFTPAGHQTGTDAGGEQVETAMYRMQAVRITGVSFPPQIVAAVDLAAVNATLEMPMDLIVGYTLYAHANWWFDFPNRRWAITSRL